MLSAWAAVILIAGLLMIPAFDQPGAELDEGVLVAFPARLLDGGLPQRDFYDPYGPASVWSVGAAYEVFGVSQSSERAVGMVYRLAIVGGVFWLALGWGLAAGLLAAVIVAATLVGSVAANASVGFFALAIPGYAMLTRALLGESSARRRSLSIAGALLGASLLMRYDFAPAVVLAALPGALVLGPSERKRFAAGFAVGLLPLALHVALVGPASFWRSVRIALGVRGHPAAPPFQSDLAELIALYALATALLLFAGAVLERRLRRDPEARVLLGSGLWGIGLVPFALSHLDTAHVLTASLPVLAMLPVAAVVLVRGDLTQRPAPAAGRAFALTAVGAVLFFAAAGSIRLQLYHPTKLLLTGDREPSFSVSNDGRSFRLGDAQAAHDAQAMIAELDRLGHRGSSVFVGPQDLRTAGDNDVYLYFLLDRLKPATYFMQLDPHTINRARNGFAHELSHTDFLVLTSRLTHQPLTDLGPGTPNQIVAKSFCARATSGTYRLYQRCR